MIVFRRDDDEGVRLGDLLFQQRDVDGRLVGRPLELLRIDQDHPETAFGPEFGQRPS